MPTLTKAARKERMKRAQQWLRLRQNFLLSQTKLADILGLSRRTVQAVEGGECSPRFSTLAAFRDYSEKLERERKREGRRESGWMA
jgi:DNA-binding XRE family transcriptional regulator